MLILIYLMFIKNYYFVNLLHNISMLIVMDLISYEHLLCLELSLMLVLPNQNDRNSISRHTVTRTIGYAHT